MRDEQDGPAVLCRRREDVPHETVALPCYACDVGHFEPLAVEGRRLPWDRQTVLLVPADVTIPTCTHCGEMAINGRLMATLASEWARQAASPGGTSREG